MNAAALYVERGGPYFDMDDVIPWDADRDARLYPGPFPVVAHPPCGPWGRLRHMYKGGDRALAQLAVSQVRRYGGVLEHPRGSLLWDYERLPPPGKRDAYGFTVEVCQVDWGHIAEKRTWLYFVGVDARRLTFPKPRQPTHWISGNKGRAAQVGMKRASAEASRRTPPMFARWLVDLAKTAVVVGR